MREIRTETDDKEENQEPDEEQVDYKKAGITVLLFVLTLLIGYFAILLIDYWDNRSQLNVAFHSIESINQSLDNPAPIQISALEDYEFDLNQMKSDFSSNKKIKKELDLTIAKLDNHLALVPSGTNIYSWATSELVRAEIDTLHIPYNKRLNYSVKSEYIPVSEKEKRAFAILKSHPLWGKDECISLASGKVWVGMTKEQLLLAKGQPKHIDKNYSSNVNSEQWAYSNLGSYYYLENGILVTIQE